MLYSYKEAIKKFKSHYQLYKAIKIGKFFIVKKGLYSDSKENDYLNAFINEYNNPIFTMESALYFYGICDEIPDRYSIATSKDSTKYNNKNIKQYFLPNNIYKLGVISYDYCGKKIQIYNKERLLLEVIRYKNKLPFDYYKEIINYYRKNISSININLLNQYWELYPKKQFIMNILQLEVF